MSLSVGIVGLPNVGKSTLFNALSSKQAEAANYPFCTIDPNIGVVPVPDKRFEALVELVQPLKQQPATVDFVDIAGLVKGASKGEGKGNAFLSNIRDCDAIAHVVRCFEDDNIVHVENRVDPVNDVEIINLELILRDLDIVLRRAEKARKLAKANSAIEHAAEAVCGRLQAALESGKRAIHVPIESPEEQKIVRDMMLLTTKPMFYVCNVKEHQLAAGNDDPLVAKVRALAAAENAECVSICAAIEAEIMQLPPADRKDFLDASGLEEPGLNAVIRTGYRMLDLITYFTSGKQEVRAWTIHRGTKAPGAAGAIHTDFERGFIRAEVMWWDDLITMKTEAAVRAAGKLKSEGKEYVVKDGDVMHFLFTV